MNNPAFIAEEHHLACLVLHTYAAALQKIEQETRPAHLGDAALMFSIAEAHLVDFTWMTAEECLACPYVRPFFQQAEQKRERCFLCVFQQFYPITEETPAGYRTAFWLPKKPATLAPCA